VAVAPRPLHQMRRRVLTSQIKDYADLDDERRLEHDEWRLRAIGRLEQQAFHMSPSGRRAGVTVDRLASDLLRISALDETYGTPDLGNKADPVDELVYIMLARRTREVAYQSAYDALRTRFASWEDLTLAPLGTIEDVIRFSGLASRKAQSLKLALEQLIDRFGACTLEPTQSWSDEETLAFLCTLPEVGPKSAACVMACSLDRPAFAVDAHVGRVLERTGTFATIGIELGDAGHKIKQRVLWDAVPPSLRYVLHVNLLVHGRERCLPGKPRCLGCPIAPQCARGARPATESSRREE
jgi:endonuclease III